MIHYFVPLEESKRLMAEDARKFAKALDAELRPWLRLCGFPAFSPCSKENQKVGG